MQQALLRHANIRNFPANCFKRLIAWSLRLVAGACSAPKPPALPFRYILVVKRRKPMIPLCSPEGGYQPSA